MMVGIVVDLKLTLHIVVSVNAVMRVDVIQQVQVYIIVFQKSFKSYECLGKHGLTSTITVVRK